MQKSSVLRIATALITLVVASGYARAQVSATSAGGYSTSATTSIAEKVEVEGTLEVRVYDYQHYSKTRYFLNTPEGRIPLHFAKNPPTHILTGAHVRVIGTRQPDSSLTLASGSASVKSAPTTKSPTGPLPNTLGAQSTLAMSSAGTQFRSAARAATPRVSRATRTRPHRRRGSISQPTPTTSMRFRIATHAAGPACRS